MCEKNDCKPYKIKVFGEIIRQSTKKQSKVIKSNQNGDYILLKKKW